MTPLQRFVRRPQQLVIRRLNFQIHLWAGIILALYLIVIGVTGSILVFRVELESLWGLRPWNGIRAKEPFADMAAVVENLKTAYPRSHIISVMAPTDTASVFLAILQGRRQITVACEPSAGTVLGEFPHVYSWLDVVRDLHVSLLLHRTGRLLNGAGAVLLLLLNVTGLVVWWPGIRNWRRALKVDFQRNWRRINFDLHSAAGFWTLAIVSVWAVSGIYFAWPRQIFQFANWLSPVITARPPAITVIPESAASQLDLHALIERARAIDPGTRLGGVRFPYGGRAPLEVVMRRRDSPDYEYDDTVYFNPYSGAYISIWRYGVNQSLGDWLIWLQVPLHFGVYWGLGIKIVWAAAGFAIPLLTVTGLLMYWNRALRRKWKRLSINRNAAASLAHASNFVVRFTAE